MKILFVCKWNRFRSRIADAYFKKINKNKRITSSSAGVFQGEYPLDKTQVKVGKEIKINIEGKPRTISSKMLKNTDLIVIVADNVPRGLFSYGYQKVIKWDISDVKSGKGEEKNRIVVNKIVKKVEELDKKLESTARCTPNYRIRGQK